MIYLSGVCEVVHFLGKHGKDFEPRDKKGEFDRLFFIILIRTVTKIFLFIQCMKILPQCENFLIKHQKSIAANSCRRNIVLL